MLKQKVLEILGTSWRRVADAPFLHATMLVLIGQAVLLLLSQGPNPWGRYTTLALATSAFLGCTLTLIGIHWRGAHILSMGIQRVGLFIICGVWVIDGYLLGLSPALIDPILFLGATVIRLVRLGNRTKDKVEDLKTLQAAVEVTERIQHVQ